MKFTTVDTQTIREISGNPQFVSEENRVGEPHGHLFKPGDTVQLVGLQSFPEYNGETVLITNIREDDDGKRAYYVKGRINAHLNWVYEHRLQPLGPATNG